MKKNAERGKRCALAVVRRSQKFRPTTDPGTLDCRNLISWRWSLHLPTKLQTQFGEDRCTQFRVIVVTDPQTHIHPQTHTHTHTQTHKPTDRTDYNTLRR